MKKLILRTALLIFGSVTLLSFTNTKDWFVAGSKPNDYKMEIEKGTGLKGGNCNHILCALNHQLAHISKWKYSLNLFYLYLQCNILLRSFFLV